MALINWYPGHIAKAQATLREQLSVIDFVLELVDARLPASSRFDMTDALLRGKPRVLVFTKADLADRALLSAWIEHYRREGQEAVVLNAQTGQGLKRLQELLDEQAGRIAERMARRGRLPRPARVMVVGLPNVGKSSLINKLAKKRSAQVGDKPGVTRGVRWIRLGKQIELLDTPGIIPPKLSDQALALKLAMIGAVSTEAYDPERLAPAVLAAIEVYAPAMLEKWESPDLEAFARKRGYVKPGGEPDLARASRTMMADLRGGAFGELGLDERPGAPDRSGALRAALGEAEKGLEEPGE